MADIVSDLAAKSGISPDMAGKGMGAVLEFCKNKLPAEAYSKLSAAVPNADGMIASANEAEQSGGILGSVKGMVGNLIGGGGGELAGKLSKIGFSMDQAKAFLPQVLGFLKSKLPADAVQKLGGMIPAAA